MTYPPAPQVFETADCAKCQPVAWLDLDPGQPEFSPAGQLSLVHVRTPILGPSFSHTSAEDTPAVRIVRAHALGALSPNENPEYFMRCAVELLVYYDTHLSTCSSGLIINCPGWVVGAAFEVMAQLIKKILPSDIVCMSAADSPFAIAIRLAAGSIPMRLLLPALRGSSAGGRTSAELRVMQYMAYFHQRPPDGHLRWCSTLIDRAPPWRLSFGKSKNDLLGVHFMGEHPHPQFLETVLVGALVAVCIIDSDSEHAEAKSCVNYSFGIPFWSQADPHEWRGLNPENSRMLGLAFVQEIDLQNKSISLQTPLSAQIRKSFASRTTAEISKLVLVYGGFDTPGWAYLESQYVRMHSDSELNSSREALSRLGEDLSLPFGVVMDGLEDTEVDEPALFASPWVKKVRRGDVAAQRWRIRRDIGRSKQERAAFEGKRRRTTIR